LRKRWRWSLGLSAERAGEAADMKRVDNEENWPFLWTTAQPVRAPRGASGGGPAYTIYCIIAHSKALTVYTSVEWHYYIWYFEFGYRHCINAFELKDTHREGAKSLSLNCGFWKIRRPRVSMMYSAVTWPGRLCCVHGRPFIVSSVSASQRPVRISYQPTHGNGDRRHKPRCFVSRPFGIALFFGSSLICAASFTRAIGLALFDESHLGDFGNRGGSRYMCFLSQGSACLALLPFSAALLARFLTSFCLSPLPSGFDT